jgi:hypothetical protein
VTKLTITAPITPAWERANAKAATLYRAGVRAQRIDARHFTVASQRPGHAAHAVEVRSVSRLDASCDCEAGVYGRPCCHASLALSAAAEAVLPALQQSAPAAPKLAPVSPAAFAARMAAA